MLHSSTVKLAVVPLLAWGVGFALLNQVVDTYAWHEILLLLTVIMVVLAYFVMLAAASRGDRKISGFAPAAKIAISSGLLLTLGSATFFVAADIGGQFVVPAVIAAASPLVTSLAAYLFDKEKLSRLNRIGAVLVVIGIALLNIQ